MSLELIIVTPEGEAYAGSVEAVVLPGTEGNFGVLERHERFLTPLRIGEVEIREASRTLYAAVSDGFAEVAGEHVVVMVETCELANQIDRARAERARKRREEELAELQRTQAEEHQFRVARTGLERSVTRLGVVRKA